MHLLYFVFGFLLLNSIQGELQLLIEMFRHGAKQSQKLDIWNSDDFSKQDELTPIGMREHYVLGQNIRNYYINQLNFVPSSYDNFDFYVRSTDSNRTLQSAISHLYGLFPIGTGPDLPIGINHTLAFPPYKNYTVVDPQFLQSNSALPLNFQPICVHTVLKEQDQLLLPFKAEACPGSKEIYKTLKNSGAYQQIYQLILPTCQSVAAKINYTQSISKLSDCSNFMDVFSSDIYANWALPQLNATEWKIMQFLQNIDMYIEHFQDAYSISFAATPMFQNIISLFNNRVTGATPKRWEIFSGHHQNIGYMLAALNLTSYQCIYEMFAYNKTSALNCVYNLPPFAANLFIELYSNDTLNNSYYVKVRYNGDYYYLCEKQQYTCEYKEFVQRLQAFTLANWTQVCGSNLTTSEVKEQGLKFHNFYQYLDSLSKNKTEKKPQQKAEQPTNGNQDEQVLKKIKITEENQIQEGIEIYDKKQENYKNYPTANKILNIFIMAQILIIIALAGYYLWSQKQNQ